VCDTYDPTTDILLMGDAEQSRRLVCMAKKLNSKTCKAFRLSLAGWGMGLNAEKPMDVASCY